MIALILPCFAFVCFALAVFPVTSRADLLALGLAFLVLSLLLARAL